MQNTAREIFLMRDSSYPEKDYGPTFHDEVYMPTEVYRLWNI
jgi:hypothetical protein